MNKILSAKVIKLLLPVIIIVASILIMVVMIKSRPEQKKVQRVVAGLLVEVLSASASDINASVKSTATVSAASEVTIVPQVSGTVVEVSRNFVPGGFFREGDLLFKVDDTDYTLELKRAKSSRAKAEYDFQTIKSRSSIAKREWEIMNSGKGEKPNPLVLYEPQLKNAQAALESADATVQMAELSLSRTSLYAPFDLRVRSESVERGQFIKAQASVGTVSGTGVAEVKVSLQPSELQWIIVPRTSFRGGSKAIIKIRGTDSSYKGKVVRSVGELDAKSRTIEVVVEVKDPYRLKSKNSQPLMNGAFVDVGISGRLMKGVYELPRRAIRDNSTVWIMGDDSLLEIRSVEVLRIEGETAFVSKGLEYGDSVVLTTISGAADGLKLRSMKEVAN